MPKVSSSWAAVQMRALEHGRGLDLADAEPRLHGLAVLELEARRQATVTGITSFSRSTSQRIACLANFSSNCGLDSASSSSWRLAWTSTAQRTSPNPQVSFFCSTPCLILVPVQVFCRAHLQVVTRRLALDEDAAQFALARLELLLLVLAFLERQGALCHEHRPADGQRNSRRQPHHPHRLTHEKPPRPRSRPRPHATDRAPPHAAAPARWSAPPSAQTWQVNVGRWVGRFSSTAGAFRPRSGSAPARPFSSQPLPRSAHSGPARRGLHVPDKFDRRGPPPAGGTECPRARGGGSTAFLGAAAAIPAASPGMGADASTSSRRGCGNVSLTVPGKDSPTRFAPRTTRHVPSARQRRARASLIEPARGQQ